MVGSVKKVFGMLMATLILIVTLILSSLNLKVK